PDCDGQFSSHRLRSDAADGLSSMRVGITGANGYVGTILRAAFAEEGHEVIAFARSNRVTSESAAAMVGVAERRPYELKRPPS
ncbi:MAG: hypothetical protein E5W01_20570, partial [Mesorhizobium sp.]